MRSLTAAAAAVTILGGSLLVSGHATAAAKGTIEGRVINESTGRPQPNVRLELTSGTESGDGEVLEAVRSDDEGRYRFDDLPTGEDRFYALDARFDGGLFAGRPISIPSNTSETPVISSMLRVWNTTTEPGVMAISSDRMFVVQDGDSVGVIESVSFVNTSEEAYIGRGAGMIGDAASGASFAFALPPGATEFNPFDSTLDIPDIVRVDQGFAATVAIPPGEHKATYSYRVVGGGGSFDLSRPVLYPTLELSIYAAEPLEVRSNRLVSKEGIELEGKTYELWGTDETIDAGDPLQALAVATGSVPMLPFAVGAVALLFLGGMAAFVLRRRPRTATAPEVGDRDRLLEEVAVLDLAYEAGEIDRARWDDARSSLLDRIRASQGSAS
jgi:hypothetical protein